MGEAPPTGHLVTLGAQRSGHLAMVGQDAGRWRLGEEPHPPSLAETLLVLFQYRRCLMSGVGLRD